MNSSIDLHEIGEWLALQRPALHRYCSRLTGSVLDGEDAVQETLLKAVQSFPGFGVVGEPKAWLFRVAHNASMDLLRLRARGPELAGAETLDAVPDESAASDASWVAHTALRFFMWLTPVERSCVVLMDVLGYSLQEITVITGRSLLAVKAALHRGRARLKEVADSEDGCGLEPLDGRQRRLLEQYASRFNARDFDAVRAMLGEEVKLDLVGRRRLSGKAEVGGYFRNYAAVNDWRFVPATLDGWPALMADHPADPDAPRYFVLLAFEREHDQVASIRDFRYSRYAAQLLSLSQVIVLDAEPPVVEGPP
jgi:RNA polymerase sigma-70 factor, ECF subfamily